MKIERNKDGEGGLTEITFSAEEARARLLPNVYKTDVLTWVSPIDPIRILVENLDEADLTRLEKEVECRNNPSWNKVIDTSEITPRLKTLLGIMDIETLGQLASSNRIDFLKYRNVGKKTLSEIEDLVYNNGLDFVG